MESTGDPQTANLKYHFKDWDMTNEANIKSDAIWRYMLLMIKRHPGHPCLLEVVEALADRYRGLMGEN